MTENASVRQLKIAHVHFATSALVGIVCDFRGQTNCQVIILKLECSLGSLDRRDQILAMLTSVWHAQKIEMSGVCVRAFFSERSKSGIIFILLSLLRRAFAVYVIADIVDSTPSAFDLQICAITVAKNVHPRASETANYDIDINTIRKCLNKHYHITVLPSGVHLQYDSACVCLHETAPFQHSSVSPISVCECCFSIKQ